MENQQDQVKEVKPTILLSLNPTYKKPQNYLIAQAQMVCSDASVAILASVGLQCQCLSLKLKLMPPGKSVREWIR